MIQKNTSTPWVSAAISDDSLLGVEKKPWFPGGNVLLWLESPGYDAGFNQNASQGRGLVFHVSGSWPCFASHGLEANVSESLWCCQKKYRIFAFGHVITFSMDTTCDMLIEYDFRIHIYIWYLSMVHRLVEIVHYSESNNQSKTPSRLGGDPAKVSRMDQQCIEGEQVLWDDRSARSCMWECPTWNDEASQKFIYFEGWIWTFQ